MLPAYPRITQKQMKQQFLVLANATHPKGRILIVSPISENGTPQRDSNLPPILFLTAFGYNGFIPTSFVVDVLPLDVIEIDVILSFSKQMTVAYDATSLKIPYRVHQRIFAAKYVNNLKSQIELFTEARPNASHLDLLSVTECRLSKTQGSSRTAKPIVDFELDGKRHSAPAIDAYLIESFETGNSFLNADKEVYVILSQKEKQPTKSCIVLGVIH